MIPSLDRWGFALMFTTRDAHPSLYGLETSDFVTATSRVYPVFRAQRLIII